MFVGLIVIFVGIIIQFSYATVKAEKIVDENIAYFEKINNYVSELKQYVSPNKELFAKVQKIDSALVFLENSYKRNEKTPFETMRKIGPR